MQTPGRKVILAWLISVALCNGPASAKVKMSSNPEKAAKVVMVHYDKTWDFTSTERATEYPRSEHDTEEVLWDLEQPGHWIWDECYGNAEGHTYNWSDTHWDADGAGDTQLTLYEDVCGVRNPGLYEPCTVSSTWWPGEFSVGGASRVVWDGYSLWDQKVQRNASTRYELHTGGKKVSGQKNLFVLTASVLGQGLFGWETYSLASSSVKLASLGNLGSDGRLYAALGGGGTYNVTPYVGGWRYYTFDPPGMSKHFLTISANGSFLSPDRVLPWASYCVGQKLNMEAVFTPAVPGLVAANPTWNFTGEYINFHYTDWNGCERYVIAPLWVTRNPTHVWYYNDGAELNANVALYCTFDNGQTAYPFSRGKFSMFKPSVAFNQYGVGAVHIRSWLGVGTVLGIGKSDGTEQIAFSANVNSIPQFEGIAKWTQLVQRECSLDGIPMPLWNTGGRFDLDNSETYPESESALINDPAQPHSNLLGTPDLSDMPGIGITIALFASCDDHFKSYLRFKPSGEDSIFITLGRADWGWSAVAFFTGLNPLNPEDWIVQFPSVSQPRSGWNVTAEFPEWTHTLHNFP